VELSFRTRSYGLRRAAEAAWGVLERREIAEVELRSLDGLVGRGEAAPLEPYDGVALGAVVAALDAYSAVLRVLPERVERADVVDACAAERALPQALAAVDMALWDLEGQRVGRPAARLISAQAPDAVVINGVIGATDRATAASEAARAAEAGLWCVKVKVGVGDDAGRLAAVRAAVGAEVSIRLDANGAWRDPEVALAQLDRLTSVGIELCEEPVHGAEALAEVTSRSPVPIAADESAGEVLAAGPAPVDLVCLKVSRCGGISGVLRDAETARAAGIDVYLASTLDGPVGIAAGLHAAAGLAAEHPLPPCGLATLGAFEEVEAPAVRDGSLPLPPGDGLGQIFGEPDRMG
jgi:L-Ala-D/L-Glu epimerase